ncbi:ABC transporter permease [Paenibacillus turicensis]|uniref:ABC transporter permease n=1 Tax=Paenibacillus turicensis TaxID=160487 RepID=UPI003D27BEB5
MLTVLKNNYIRMFERKGSIIIMGVLMILAIILAVYMTGLQETKGHIVFVTKATEAPIQSPYLKIDVMQEKPPYSELMKHKYDAYVWEKEDKTFGIESVKNDEFKALLTRLLSDKDIDPSSISVSSDRGIGANIIGFLMMFLLMASSLFLFTFSEDKEQGVLKRIACSPISVMKYVLAHIVTCLTMYTPAFLCLIIMKLIGYDIGFSLLQYAGFILIIGLLGISLMLVLFTLFHKPDNATMLANSIMILTTILAGSFYSFDQHNKGIEWVVSILPQKHLLSFAGYVEHGTALAHIGSLIYVIILVGGLLLFATWCLKQRYVKQK